MAHFRATGRTSTSLAGTLPDFFLARERGAGARPLEIDVGCHKGRFLVEMARNHPSSNFIGVERQRERAEKAQEKISRLGLENAAVLHEEGLEAISRLPDACVDYVHVLFPDPWPKRRHQVRRIVHAAFLREVSRVLKDRGLLRLLTDDRDYARAMELLAADVEVFQPGKDGREYPPTEFQVKFLADSRPVYPLFFQRIS